VKLNAAATQQKKRFICWFLLFMLSPQKEKAAAGQKTEFFWGKHDLDAAPRRDDLIK